MRRISFSFILKEKETKRKVPAHPPHRQRRWGGWAGESLFLLLFLFREKAGYRQKYHNERNEDRMSIVLDISKYQEKVNFTAAKLRNVKAVIARCAYGSAKDSKFDSYAKGAESAKMPLGAYMFATWHYSSVSPDFKTAKKNVQTQTETALSYLSGKKITAPVAVDLELESGAKLELSKKELTELAEYAMDIIKKAGYTPMLYCSVSWLYDRMEPDKLTRPLWLAYYFEGAKQDKFPDTKYGKLLEAQKKKLVLWQYSSTGQGSFYGASSKFVDLNFDYGFEKFMTETPSVTPTPSAPETKSLYTVKIKDGTWNVRASNTTDSNSKAIIKGGVTLQASQKKNGWFYLVSQKGWIGPAAVESWVYNKKYTTYVVKKGDNLTKIAKEFSTTVDRIYDDNRSAYPRMTRDYILPGWKLKIYTV